MKTLISTVLMCLVACGIFAQSDPILGKWQNPSGEGRIEITKKGDKYFGTLFWMKAPNEANGQPKKDLKNPDKALQARHIQGLEILTNFSKTGDKVYEGGKIYDPKSGKTYSCKMTLKDNKTLDIRGFVGVSIMGRTETWKRVE